MKQPRLCFCFCSLCKLVLPKTLRFSLQRHKAQEFGEAEFCGFGLRPLVSRGFLGAKAEFVGFGSRFLVSNGFLDAKAGHPD